MIDENECGTCDGTGEITICMACASEIDMCECEGDCSPGTDLEECPECEGTGVEQ